MVFSAVTLIIVVAVVVVVVVAVVVVLLLVLLVLLVLVLVAAAAVAAAAAVSAAYVICWSTAAMAYTVCSIDCLVLQSLALSVAAGKKSSSNSMAVSAHLAHYCGGRRPTNRCE